MQLIRSEWTLLESRVRVLISAVHPLSLRLLPTHCGHSSTIMLGRRRRCWMMDRCSPLALPLLAAVLFGASVMAQPHEHVPRARAPEPLVLQPSEGESRIRRPPPSSLSTLAAPFLIKVDERNGGAKDFVIFTEDVPVGQTISPHRHPLEQPRVSCSKCPAPEGPSCSRGHARPLDRSSPPRAKTTGSRFN